jgi:hypothetical protein
MRALSGDSLSRSTERAALMTKRLPAKRFLNTCQALECPYSTSSECLGHQTQQLTRQYQPLQYQPARAGRKFAANSMLVVLAQHSRENNKVELARVQLFVDIAERGNQGAIAARGKYSLPSRKKPKSTPTHRIRYLMTGPFLERSLKPGKSAIGQSATEQIGHKDKKRRERRIETADKKTSYRRKYSLD